MKLSFAFIIMWLAFIEGNAALHWFEIEKKQHWPNHPVWTVIRLAVLVVLSYLLSYDWGSFWLLVVGGTMIFPLAFNVPLNFMRGKPPGYLGDHGIDAIVKECFPESVIFYWSIILFVGGIGIIIQGIAL